MFVRAYMRERYKPESWKLLHQIPIPPQRILQEYGTTIQYLNDHKQIADMINLGREWKDNIENFSKCVSLEGNVVFNFQVIMDLHSRRGMVTSIKLANVSELATTVIQYIIYIQSRRFFERRLLSFQ